jgi:hypothetical protein
MPSSGMLHRVVFVKTDVSEERVASILRLERISKLGTLIGNVPSSLFLSTLKMEATRSSETSAQRRPNRHNISEDRILQAVNTYVYNTSFSRTYWLQRAIVFKRIANNDFHQYCTYIRAE